MALSLRAACHFYDTPLTIQRIHLARWPLAYRSVMQLNDDELCG